MTLDNVLILSAQRWLHSINLITNHPLVGVADREYWAWKTKDFPNGTWQAGLSGFLDSLPLLNFEKSQVKEIVDKVIQGTKTIQRSNGSFEEAYPFESSYAVTGLVAYNTLYSYYTHGEYFGPAATGALKEISKKAYTFLKNTKETHGTISNHVVTTELALLLLEKFLNKSSDFDAFKNRLSSLQLEPGVFAEYSGADPGYQTLLNHYWTAATRIIDEKSIQYSEIRHSLDFVNNFVMLDQKFAGLCGSRGTNVIYPSGLLGNSRLTLWFENEHFRDKSCVNPLVADPGNFVPIFNSWAFYLKNRSTSKVYSTASNPINIQYPKAQLTVKVGRESCLIWNEKTCVFQGCVKKKGIWTDQSFYGYQNYNLATQQSPMILKDSSVGKISYELTATKLQFVTYTLFKAICLRLLTLTVYWFPILQRALKLILKKFVMDNKSLPRPTGLVISIDYNENDVSLILPKSESWTLTEPFFLKHMASANYFSRNVSRKSERDL